MECKDQSGDGVPMKHFLSDEVTDLHLTREETLSTGIAAVMTAL
jgi:hypothetical protein